MSQIRCAPARSVARLSYAAITPARNEASNLSRLAASLRAQTVPPGEWIIVDNGSTDSTADVASALAGEIPWTRMLSIPAGAPARGGPVVRAFQAGLGALETVPDVVVKLDADVSMEPDYFARLLARFERDEALGMASGAAQEKVNGRWRERPVTAGHVWGPARAYRWACLQDVLPLEERTGWDGIDELKASVRGWRTTSFRDLPFWHHRAQGGREGARWRHWKTQGDAAHYMGYRPLYLILRALFCARREPSALGMIWAYITATFRRKPQCSDVAVRRYLRQQQSFRRLPRRIREVRAKS